MKRFKLEHNRPDCIGCGACAAVCPAFWVMHDDGKSDIVGGKERPDNWQELDIDEKDFETNKEAAEVCPVNVIHLTDIEEKKKII